MLEDEGASHSREMDVDDGVLSAVTKCVPFLISILLHCWVNRCDRNKANRCSATIFIFSPTEKKVD